MAGLIIVTLSACAAHPDAGAAFVVERISVDAQGNDLDDAPPSVTLRVGARQVPAGPMLGWCTGLDKASAFVRESCAAGVPDRTIASLACGDDPHVDTVICLYAVRASGKVELWRRDVTFVDSNDAPRTVSRKALVRVGATSER